MNTEELSRMSYILQTSEPKREVQNRSPEFHFNPPLKNLNQSKPQNLLKIVFQKAVVLIPEVRISLHSRQNVTTKATKNHE